MKKVINNYSFLDKQRTVGDLDADKLVSSIFKQNRQAELYQFFALSEKEFMQGNSLANIFLQIQKQQPTWYDEDRIIKGQTIFENYAMSIMTLLGVMSLPYCYAASPGNKALYLTEKMRKSPGKRLAETGEFTISVLRRGSLQKNQAGIFHITKTRLIHSMARYYLQKDSWDKSWGIPINQEDMAGTNMAFSYVILTGLQLSGIILSQQQKEDFLFVWRYIGYHLGIEESLLPENFQEARALSETIKKRTLQKTEEGIILTQELVNYYKSVLPKRQAEFVESQIRYYLGNEVAEYIGMPAYSLKDRLVNFTNSFKELENIFSVPKNSMNELTQNYQRMKSKSAY